MLILEVTPPGTVARLAGVEVEELAGLLALGEYAVSPKWEVCDD